MDFLVLIVFLAVILMAMCMGQMGPSFILAAVRLRKDR